MSRFIHIKAVSDIFSVNEIVPEKKAVKRLEQIRDHFMYMNSRSKNDNKLIVKTCVHNPTIF